MPDNYGGPDNYGPDNYGPENYGPEYGQRNYSEPGRGRRDFEPGGNDEMSMDALARSDRFIDALAADSHLPQMGRADYELATLLAGWRDEMRYPEPAELISERQAVQALRRGLSERKGRRGLAAIGSVAAAMLAVGGFATFTYNAEPGDSLYSLRTAIFGEPATVRDDSVVLAAQTELDQVQELISRGEWEQAQQQLSALTTTVETVEDQSRKQELIEEWNRLNVQVVERDPNATVPPETQQVLPPDESMAVTPPPPGETPSSEPSSTTPPSTTPGESTTDTSTILATTTPEQPSTSAAQTPPPTTSSSVTVTTTAPSTTVPAEPPPTATSTVVLPTTTTTTMPPVVVEPTVDEPEPNLEVPSPPAVVEVPTVEVPVPAISGGDEDESATG